MTDSDELASIVIPVHNGLPYLRDAVESALAQTYAPIEVVVVENGSTDGTAAMLREFADPRLRVVFRDSVQSAADNWTQAIAESTGRFVKLICADDVIDADCVAAQVATLRAQPSATMTACRRRIIDAAGAVLRPEHGLGKMQGLVDGWTALRNAYLSGTNPFGEPAAVMFDGAAIRAAMPWRADWPYMIDLATYAKVLEHGNVVCDRRVMASFRVSGSSWSSELLDEQPVQFRRWRDDLAAAGRVPLRSGDRLRSELSLRARTFVRRRYFKRAAAKAASG